MKYGAVLILCVLLASCATMKNADTRPTEGPCVEKYDSAKTGEKAALAGVILLPVGSVLIGGGIPLAVIGSFVGGDSSGGEGLFPSGIVLAAVGGFALFGGVMALVAGNHSINKWNDTCVGATAAERYCLFEPLPTSSGETP